jgi:hypothetical protein
MRNRVAIVGVSGVLTALLAACNSFDEPGVKGDAKLVIPVDSRVATQALTKLPAISGGTLAVASDGLRAVAADPDRDRVSIIDLVTSTATHLKLEAGDEPGRVVISPSNIAYVALRGAGALLAIDLARGEVVTRKQICAAPRGLGLQPGTALLHVACAEGRLVSLDTTNHTVQRELRLDADLRDVMPDATTIRLSTFKSSELLTVDANGTVLARTAPQPFDLAVNEAQRHSDGFESFGQRPRPMQPRMAWRTLQAQDGSVMMLHQASTTEEIDIKHREESIESGSTSPYGGGGSDGFSSCQGVVVSGISSFGTAGPHQTIALAEGVLDVDMAINGTGTEIAIVEAGTADRDAPRPKIVSDPESSTPSSGASFGGFAGTDPAFFGEVPQTKHIPESRLFRLSVAGNQVNAPFINGPITENGSFRGCSLPGQTHDVPGQATAVAYAQDGSLLVQSREPALVAILGTRSKLIELGGESVRDTGHALFHRNSGGGIACASCHGEGAEDGHTWNFKGQGLRRTQALHVGLRGTAPFHWDGEEADLDLLMEDVFVGRMGGVHQSDERVTALSRFLFDLDAPAAGRDPAEPAALRGKELFESSATGCTNCHNGANFSDNKSYDVGTSAGLHLQVPSLRAVGYRAPFIHTGCAKTLEDRFDPACGGQKHGEVAHLNPAQIDDLVAYLQTL